MASGRVPKTSIIFFILSLLKDTAEIKNYLFISPFKRFERFMDCQENYNITFFVGLAILRKCKVLMILYVWLNNQDFRVEAFFDNLADDLSCR